jgi:hypothetical protein
MNACYLIRLDLVSPLPTGLYLIENKMGLEEGVLVEWCINRSSEVLRL